MAAEHPREDEGKGPPVFFNGDRHDHYLQKFEGHRGSYMCEGCKEKGMKIGYECIAPSCHSGIQLYFHDLCARSPNELEHQISHLTFSFQKKTGNPFRRCTACDHELKGFVYKNERWDIRLHPRCFLLPPKFEYQNDILELIRGKGAAYTCCYCGHTIKHGWRYQSESSKSDYMDVNCARNYIDGLKEYGSQAHRRRDCIRDAVDPIGRFIMCALGVAGAALGTAGAAQG